MEKIKTIDSYYSKKKVYGSSPLKEIVYELEDCYEYDPFSEMMYVSKENVSKIIHRHLNTVTEFKKRLSKLID